MRMESFSFSVVFKRKIKFVTGTDYFILCLQLVPKKQLRLVAHYDILRLLEKMIEVLLI